MDAIETLMKHMKHARSDTGGSRRCAMFLLSLCNGDNFKADLQDILYNDRDIFDAMIELLTYLHNNHLQLDSLVSQAEIDPIIDMWGDDFRTPRPGNSTPAP
jgi:hypothetical protein